MIPQRYGIRISCDSCGASKQFVLSADDIDEKGLSIALDEILRDEAWETLSDFTFCPECVGRALSEALNVLVHRIESKPHEQTAETEGCS